ncbi:hypothetical protein OGATHE_001412 [Ogataea polymorpha]|uniref:Secreted protein n=1 Tax=Ogataea polymorpha TaxID=460523 RepID=A0A9P8PRE1_9ASCO|nr:hypothetical protein OGATHE_001412 [Ogataea polymorpha]
MMALTMSPLCSFRAFTALALETLVCSTMISISPESRPVSSTSSSSSSAGAVLSANEAACRSAVMDSGSFGASPSLTAAAACWAAS